MDEKQLKERVKQLEEALDYIVDQYESDFVEEELAELGPRDRCIYQVAKDKKK